MSFLVKSAFSFIAEPFKAAHKLYETSLLFCRNKPIAKKIIVKDANIDSILRVSDSTALKINTFITEIGGDPTNILLIKGSLRSDPFCATKHSINDEGFAVMRLSSDMLKEIDCEFTNKHKFIIAHELGHILNDDNGIGLRRELWVSNAASLGAYLITTAALNVLFPMSTIASHLTACAVARVSRFVFPLNERFKMEYRADHFAASTSIAIAEGGRNDFLEKMQVNLAKLALVKQIFDRDKNKLGFSKKLKYILIKCLASPNGDDITDFNHPKMSNRVAAIEKIIEEHLQKEAS